MKEFEQKQRDQRDAACVELERLGTTRLVTMLVNARTEQRADQERANKLQERLDRMNDFVNAAKSTLIVALPNHSGKTLLELCEIVRKHLEEGAAPF